MGPEHFRDCLVLTGPTGAGKSRLALELAEEIGAEIVSMDSMAIYRGMDIGTAKPTPEERRRVPHHLIDVLDPWEGASVAWWLERAAAACREVAARGRRTLVVGGTALYLKALLYGLFDGPPADAALRDQLTAEAERDGPATLHARLAAADPASAARLHPNDVRRVVRALEVQQLTGRPLSDWQTQWSRGPCDGPQCVWLDLPREDLYTRIDRRVEAMFAAGLVAEVAALRALPCPLSREATQGLGYKEVLAHLEGQVDLATTVEQVQRRSRNFAKRQLTWFRSLAECRPARTAAEARDMLLAP